MLIVVIVLISCSMLGVLVMLAGGSERNEVDEIAARWADQQRWRSLATPPALPPNQS